MIRFLFFFFLEKFTATHSLDWKIDFFFRHGKKKNALFTHSLDFGQKVPKNNLFRGKNKKRYLWLLLAKRYFYFDFFLIWWTMIPVSNSFFYYTARQFLEKYISHMSFHITKNILKLPIFFWALFVFYHFFVLVSFLWSFHPWPQPIL